MRQAVEATAGNWTAARSLCIGCERELMDKEACLKDCERLRDYQKTLDSQCYLSRRVGGVQIYGTSSGGRKIREVD